MIYCSKKSIYYIFQNYVKPPEFCDAEGLNPHLWIRDTSAATTGGLSGFEGSSSTLAQVAVTKRRCKETSSPILSPPSPQVHEQEPQNKRRGLRVGITDLVGLRGNNPWSKSNRVDKSNGTAAQNDTRVYIFTRNPKHITNIHYTDTYICVYTCRHSVSDVMCANNMSCLQ